MSFLNTLKAKLLSQPSGSAFSKIAHADEKVQEAKGRIVAIDAVNREKHAVAANLEQEASRVHTETDEVHTRLDNILGRL